jgi:hypothetical protein
MLRVVQTVCVIAVLAIGAGCISLDPVYTTNHLAAAAAAEKRGDFALAQRHYDTNRMALRAAVGVLGPDFEALALFAWGRASIQIGNTGDVEWAFPRIFSLIDRSGSNTADLRTPALAEFARYLHDTDQHERAVPVFADALEALDTREMVTEDPIAVAEFLDDYATSLLKSGRPEEAVTASQRSAFLKESHPGLSAKYRPKRYPSSRRTRL